MEDLNIRIFRLLMFLQLYSLIGFQRNHRIYYLLIILCINYLKNQAQIQNRSPGRLIKLSIKSSDYSQRRYIRDLLKITHPHVASSKILLDHSFHAVRNAPTNSQLLFDSLNQNLFLKRNNIDSCPLLPITHLCNLRNCLIWLQVLSEN